MRKFKGDVKIKYPKNQDVCETFLQDDMPKYIITVNKNKDKFTLYSVADNGSIAKISTRNTPIFPEVKGERKD